MNRAAHHLLQVHYLTVFLDLAKAFDTVSIPRLLYKLERLGIRRIPLKLMEDYLPGRKQQKGKVTV